MEHSVLVEVLINDGSHFFFTFDIGLVAIVVLMFILAIIDSLAPLLPFFVVLLWILYGLSAAAAAFMVIGFPDKIHRRIINTAYSGMAYYVIFILLQDYIHSIQRAGEMSGLNEAIEFALATLFGGVPVFLLVSLLCLEVSSYLVKTILGSTARNLPSVASDYLSFIRFSSKEPYNARIPLSFSEAAFRVYQIGNNRKKYKVSSR